MFIVYHSNQLDLLKQLMAILMEQHPLPTPLSREVILVQNPGMAQWLQIELAQHLGIAANIDFPLPATFIWNLFTQIIPGVAKESAFSKEAMAWKLMCLLPQMLQREEFVTLARYLADDEDQRKHFQLATKIADLYDQYLVYRPQWIQSWEKGVHIAGLDDAQQWLAPLWSELQNYTIELQQPQWHRANLYQHFLHLIAQAKSCPAGLPKRIFICGISALPPIYLDIFQALSRHIEVHLMLTNPCRYYWGDIQDYGFLTYLQRRKRQHYLASVSQPLSLFRDPEKAATLFREDGEQMLSNPLLASWGKLGRDYLFLLTQHEIQEVCAFVEPSTDCLLHRIQRDLLELEDHTQIGDCLARSERSQTKRLLHLDDRSISIQVCHSPQREVEVLHDRLLELFANDPQLTVRDVIVMVADIDRYTPFIQGVFGHATTPVLPFSISDRSVRQTHSIIQAFLKLLELPGSRFTAEEVLALLEVPALAKRFDINEEGLRLLRYWVDEVGIRWGLDEETQRELELPITRQHTWQFGLTRMLLGYAMNSHCGDWQGGLPYDGSAGMVAQLAGQLAQLIMQLCNWRSRLGEVQSLSQWQPLCRELLDTFFTIEAEHQVVDSLIEQQWLAVINAGLTAGYLQPLPVTILRDELIARLDHQSISQRFLSGVIHFCTLMPMRSIPFKVICLLGMNDGVYPRTPPSLGFDLMANQVQRGDRSRRDDDRYLFLEALISAQQRFYISYIGRSIQDNALRYPSVLVTELLEYIAQSHCLPGDETLDIDRRAQRVMEHLQIWSSRVPFSVQNYQLESSSQSYNKAWLPAAQGKGVAPLPFIQPLIEEEITQITLEELIAFYRHPIRAFFQQRLGVSFMDVATTLSEEEPFDLDPLSCYKINQQLLNCLIEQQDPSLLYRYFQTAGQLPYGAFGERFWLQQQQEMTELAAQIHCFRQYAERWEIDCQLGNIRLTGWLQQVQPDGLVRWRPTQLNIEDGMTLWIEHLLYCFNGGTGESRCLGRQQTTWHFSAMSIEAAQQALLSLLGGYCFGRTQPLLLLPKSGWAWLHHCFNRERRVIDWSEETQAKAQAKLRQAWLGDRYVPGESNDLYIQRVMPRWDEQYRRLIQQQAITYYLPLVRNHLD